MINANDDNIDNKKSFDAYANESKIFDITMKYEKEMNKLMFKTILIEDSKKKIYCSLFSFEFLNKIELLSYNTAQEIFYQICDYLDVNEKLKIKNFIVFHASKATLTITINSRKFKQLNFGIKIWRFRLLDTVDKLNKKNEELAKRLSALEEIVFNKKIEITKKEDKAQFFDKIENLTNSEKNKLIQVILVILFFYKMKNSHKLSWLLHKNI